MKLNKEVLLDRLRRAYEMEEVMASKLIELAQESSLSEEISQEDRPRILGILASIKKDTLRHSAVVQDMIQKVSKGIYEI